MVIAILKINVSEVKTFLLINYLLIINLQNDSI